MQFDSLNLQSHYTLEMSWENKKANGNRIATEIGFNPQYIFRNKNYTKTFLKALDKYNKDKYSFGGKSLSQGITLTKSFEKHRKKYIQVCYD